MKKRISALLLVTAIIACITGCKYEHGIEITMFGSARVFESQTMGEDIISNSYGDSDSFYKTIEDTYTPSGYKVERFEETGEGGAVEYGYKATSPSMPGSNVSAELEKMMADFDITYTNTGLFTKNVEVVLKTSSEPLEGYEQYGITDTFTIKTPGPVLSTNGTAAAGKSNTIQWDIANLEFGSGTEMTLNVSYLNPLVLLILCFLILVVIVLVIILVVSNSKKKKAALEAVAPAFDAPAEGASFGNFGNEVQEQVSGVTFTEVQEQAEEAVEAQAEDFAETQRIDVSEVEEALQAKAEETAGEVKEAAAEVTEAVEEVKTEE